MFYQYCSLMSLKQEAFGQIYALDLIFLHKIIPFLGCLSLVSHICTHLGYFPSLHNKTIRVVLAKFQLYIKNIVYYS